jgi:hypothetical protein
MDFFLKKKGSQAQEKKNEMCRKMTNEQSFGSDLFDVSPGLTRRFVGSKRPPGKDNKTW